MKTTIKLLSLSLLSFLFASCCCTGPGTIEGEKKVIVHEQSTEFVSHGKGGKGSEVLVSTPVEKTVKVTHRCTKCGSWFCPKPQCCGIVSKSVLERATAQGGTGEPFIGLIPTMKTLAPAN